MEDKEKKPVKLPAVGDIITKTKITSIYGNLGRDTSLLDYVKVLPRKRGEIARFEVTQPLPTMEEFSAALQEKYTVKAEDALSEAFGEIESLKDELQEWHDNLPENLQSGSKADEIDEAVNILDGISEVELPEGLDSLKVTVFPDYSDNRYSRPSRSAQAGATLDAVSSALEDYIATAESDDEGSAAVKAEIEAAGTSIDDLNSLKDEIEEASSELSGVDYPGMF